MSSEKNTRVLIISSLFHPCIGGAEKQHKSLCSTLVEKGVCLTVLTRKTKGLAGFEIIDNIPVYRKIITIPLGPLWGISYMFSIFFFLLFNLKKYQIIHCSQIYLHILVALFFKCFFRKKVIVRLSGSSFYGDFERISKLKGGSLIVKASRWVDKVVAISDEIEKELISNGFSREKIILIPNGVDVKYFSPKKEGKIQSLPNICFIGRLEKGKGLVTLIDAFWRISKECTHARLTLVGGGSLAAELMRQIERLNLVNYVNVVGEQDNVLPYYRQSEIVILPSESEGMSNVLLEAMACGLPVIATDIGGNVELVGKKKEVVAGVEGGSYLICENGILVPPRNSEILAEAILALMDNKILAESMGCSGRKKVEEFYTLNQVVEEYISLYRGL